MVKPKLTLENKWLTGQFYFRYLLFEGLGDLPGCPKVRNHIRDIFALIRHVSEIITNNNNMMGKRFYSGYCSACMPFQFNAVGEESSDLLAVKTSRWSSLSYWKRVMWFLTLCDTLLSTNMTYRLQLLFL